MAAVRGGHRHHKDGWEQTRWQTWVLLRALGNNDMNSPSDLVQFAWEKENAGVSPDDLPTDDEIRQMQEQMRRENEERNKEIS